MDHEAGATFEDDAIFTSAWRRLTERIEAHAHAYKCSARRYHSRGEIPPPSLLRRYSAAISPVRLDEDGTIRWPADLALPTRDLYYITRTPQTYPMPKLTASTHHQEEYHYPLTPSSLPLFTYPLPRVHLSRSPPPSPSKRQQDDDPDVTDHDAFLNCTLAAESMRARRLTFLNAKVAKASKRRLAAKLLL